MSQKQILNALSLICLCIALAIGGYGYGASRTATEIYIETHVYMSDYLNAETQRVQSSFTDKGQTVPYPTLGYIAELSIKVESSMVKRNLAPAMMLWFGVWPLMAISVGIQGYIARVLDRKPLHPQNFLPNPAG